MEKLRFRNGIVFTFVLVSVFSFLFVCSATEAKLYFSSDRLGQNPVVHIQEGDSVWVVVTDNDENLGELHLDRFYADIIILDSHTGAILDPTSFPAPAYEPTVGHASQIPEGIFMIETGANTGVFISEHPIQLGQRMAWDDPTEGYHTAGSLFSATQSRSHVYFENMDTVLGIYQDWNDQSDTAISMLKIIDTCASISWSSEVLWDPSIAASVTVVDPDENLNRSKIEAIPVFILVNPGSWNALTPGSATTFPSLFMSGGIDGITGLIVPTGSQISPQSIYNAEANLKGARGAADGRYYVQYPDWAGTSSPHGIVPVSFWAMETGVDTGVFVLALDNISLDLGFFELSPRDTLVAYYIDPNDFDDFTLATSHVYERQHSITQLTTGSRAVQGEYRVGSDAAYVQVIDANANIDPCCPESVLVHAFSTGSTMDEEFLVLHETSSNSPVFFSFAGTPLVPLYPGRLTAVPSDSNNLRDNWLLDVPNEATLCVRYNDVYIDRADVENLGDGVIGTGFPPSISRVRVFNDVSFALARIADTQVAPIDNSEAVSMYFLDRQGNRVSGYVTTDCVFIEVVDPDQDENPNQRERIDAFTASATARELRPQALNRFSYDFKRVSQHTEHSLLGDTNILGNETAPLIFVLNPRNGRWAALDLYETGTSTGSFVSLECVSLSSVYDAVPTLEVRPGDTLLACYQDPSNPSDSAWISTHVGIGGGGFPPSTTVETAHEIANAVSSDVEGNEPTSSKTQPSIPAEIVSAETDAQQYAVLRRVLGAALLLAIAAWGSWRLLCV